MAEIIVSLLIFIIIINLYPVGVRYLNSRVPTTDWFVVNQLQIDPIILLGSEIKFVYDRKILQPYDARWIVEVQQVNSDGTLTVVCSGEGNSSYDMTKVLPREDEGEAVDQKTISVTLDWFIGHDNCELPVGKYRIFVKWFIDRGEYYNVTPVERLSNVFQIVDKEQVIEKIEALPNY